MGTSAQQSCDSSNDPAASTKRSAISAFGPMVDWRVDCQRMRGQPANLSSLPTSNTEQPAFAADNSCSQPFGTVRSVLQWGPPELDQGNEMFCRDDQGWRGETAEEPMGVDDDHGHDGGTMSRYWGELHGTAERSASAPALRMIPRSVVIGQPRHQAAPTQESSEQSNLSAFDVSMSFL